MDLTALSIFVQVARRGTFAVVARDRGTDASSISRTISSLEATLGVRLFQRTTRRLALTEAGATYFERVAPLLEGLDAANAEVADLGEQPRGNLRVTAPLVIGQRLIVPMLPDLLERHPDLSVDLVLSDSIQDIVAERIDLAVRIGELPDSRLVAHRLIDMAYRVYASPAYLARHGHPASPDELASRDCLRFSMPAFRNQWQFRRAGDPVAHAVSVSGRVVTSSGLAIEECALQGLGIALLPPWLVHDNARAGRLVEVFPGWEVSATGFATAAWLVYPTRSYVPVKLRAFVDCLKARVATMAGGDGERR